MNEDIKAELNIIEKQLRHIEQDYKFYSIRDEYKLLAVFVITKERIEESLERLQGIIENRYKHQEGIRTECISK